MEVRRMTHKREALLAMTERSQRCFSSDGRKRRCGG